MQGIDDRTITDSQRREIFERDDYMCGYCFGDATCVDHIIPWSFTRDDRESNLMSSCWLCNLIASNKVFDSFRLKQAHIQGRRYKWIKKNPIPLWITEEVEALGYELQEQVRATVIILENEEQRQNTKRILLDEGFRVIC